MPTKKKLLTYDPAEDLLTEEGIQLFMEDAFASEDAAYLAHALGVVARAKGMTQIARETGLSREQLYRSFSKDGNPSLQSTFAVLKACGVKWTTTLRDAA
jgi:probable addiction module antidote protein